MKSLANEFFVTMAEGAKAHHAPNAGAYTLRVNGIRNESDLAQQVALVEQMMAPGVDAIVPIEATIVRLKREYPGWGAPKIREKLRKQITAPHLPAISTVHAVLDRHGLVKRRRRRRSATAAGTELSRPAEPNALWCADYKGEFMLRNRRYCYPLTITDFATRYLLVCEALPSTQAQFAFIAFERAFKDFGLPRIIRTDNGLPFAAPTALYRLSKLAVVSFMQYDLGYFDDEAVRVEPIENPFGPKVLPMSPE